MKLYSQSEVSVGIPFMHLAYVAAQTHFERFSGSTAILIVAVITLFIIQRKRLLWKIALGTITLIALAAVLMYPWKPHYVYPEGVTRANAQMLGREIRYAQAAGKLIPATTEIINNEWNLENDCARDGWGNYFRIQNHPHGKNVDCKITSSGPDERFGTKDDMVALLDDSGLYRMLDKRR